MLSCGPEDVPRDCPEVRVTYRLWPLHLSKMQTCPLASQSLGLLCCSELGCCSAWAGARAVLRESAPYSASVYSFFLTSRNLNAVPLMAVTAKYASVGRAEMTKLL